MESRVAPPARPVSESTVESAALRAEDVTIRYGDVTAVDRLSLTVGRGEFTALLGPSGCGKTTFLRAIAGLNQLSAGSIAIAGRPMADGRLHVPPERRPLNMVFQSYAIWPHLSVRANVGYGVRGQGIRGRELKDRVDETLAAVGLLHYADRYGTELSGGQQQRVAVARALATRPFLMLYDEPLSNLDAGLREQVREQIVDLHHRFDTTTIYVTHDQAEALSMADRVVLMNAGRIEQESDPRSLYHRPESEFAARFVGQINALPATVAEVGEDFTDVALLDQPGRTLRLRGSRRPRTPGAAGQAVVRPEYFEVTTGGDASDDTRNVFVGEVTRAAFIGSRIQCVVATGAVDLAVEVSGVREIRQGDRVSVRVDPARIIWIDEQPSEER
ncbi:ABC transporter ATP-binding protein [Actinophytocola gossypii]|uniref:ABC transporter ATP-binding protein n=1 Tax=Actinophytocola gossypii TaxID=2812003 RepID=A0ABT2JDE3_9PSEU|nr:ABC transporter ATP-binding protein [Actinophytocola gossypii]MCT2585887.1 ABC transporter ATP-binding protein [Actinophytocola gossypii]